MRKTIIAMGLLFIAILLPGCAKNDTMLVTDPAENVEECAAVLSCKEEDIRYTSNVERGNDNEEYASIILEEALRDTGKTEGIEYRYAGVSTTPDLSVYYYQQYYNDIPVYNYTLSISAGNGGSSWSVSGTVLILEGEVNCNITKEEAEECAKEYLLKELGLAEENYTLGNLGLYINCDNENTAYTTYLFEQYGADGSETVLRTLFVSAETGEIMHDYDAVLY